MYVFVPIPWMHIENLGQPSHLGEYLLEWRTQHAAWTCQDLGVAPIMGSGSVRPLPPSRGVYDDTGSLGADCGETPHSQRPTKGAGNDGRRAVFPRAHQSSPSSYDEPTRLEARVCPGRPKNNKDEVRGRTYRPAMKRRHRLSHGPSGRPALPGGGASEGVRFSPKDAAPRPTARSGTFGRIYGQLQHVPPTLTTWVGTTCTYAVQFSIHPTTGHVVDTCDLPQPAAPIPRGWTSRRAPVGRFRPAGQEQHDERSQRPRRGEGRGGLRGP